MCEALRSKTCVRNSLLFHYTLTLLTTEIWSEMKHLVSRSISERQTYILNVVILIISVLSTTGAGWIILSFIVCPPDFILCCSKLLTVLVFQISQDFQAPIDPVNHILPSSSSLLLTTTGASPPATSSWR